MICSCLITTFFSSLSSVWCTWISAFKFDIPWIIVEYGYFYDLKTLSHASNTKLAQRKSIRLEIPFSILSGGNLFCWIFLLYPMLSVPNKGCQPWVWGKNLLFEKNFTGNYMKWKKLGRGGLRASPTPLLGSTNVYRQHCQLCVITEKLE